MKHAIHLLLAFTLAAAPWGCNRDSSNDGAASANSDNTQPAPPAVNPTVRETPRAAAPAPKPKAPAAVPDDMDRVDNPKPAPEPVRTAAMATVRAGTPITVAMIDSVGTDKSAVGDTFTASLVEPLTVEGNVVAERGAKVTGRIQNVQEPGKVQGRASLELVLTHITTGGKTYSFNTDSFVAVAEDNKQRDAGIIAGGAGVGAVIGGIAGGKKGAAIGAIIGGGSGTTAVLVTKGQDMKIDSETRVRFLTQGDVRLPVIRNTVS